MALPVEKIREWIREMKVDARKEEAEDLNEEWYNRTKNGIIESGGPTKKSKSVGGSGI